MFGLLNGLTKAVVGTVLLPVALVHDAAEVVGLTNDSGQNHTGNALSGVVQNLENAVDPNRD